MYRVHCVLVHCEGCKREGGILHGESVSRAGLSCYALDREACLSWKREQLLSEVLVLVVW